MEFEQLLSLVPDTGLFRTGHLLAGVRNPSSVRRQLGRWVTNGRVVQLRRGVYQLADPFRKVTPHPFVVANFLRRGSYVSLQSALSHYGMIPEYVPVTTSVSGNRPEMLATPMGRFQFRHLGPPFLFGFGEEETAPGQSAFLATPAKALVDLIHLTPRADDPDFLDELRLVLPNDHDAEAYHAMAKRMESPKIERAMRHILESNNAVA